MVIFAVPAKKLYDLVRINRREEDKRKGYQRALLPGRASAIASFIDSGNPLPTNIVVALDRAKYNKEKKQIHIEPGGDAGWVIDGQHRLAGAYEADGNIDVAVTAFLDLSEDEQVAQFVTINREAKRVPTSLYLDLLPDIKTMKKTESDLSKERAVDLANEVKVDEESPFFNRIVALKSPGRGQLSLTNFVRKIAPLVHRSNGILRTRTQKEQRAMIENYFNALGDIFPSEYDKSDAIFFRTVGFGGVMNAFITVHDITLRRTHDSFKRPDIVETLRPISTFNFSGWRNFGTGSAAEISAGVALSSMLRTTSGIDSDDGGTLQV